MNSGVLCMAQRSAEATVANPAEPLTPYPLRDALSNSIIQAELQ